eukprot:TRINITY_DN49957_c0_g1_i1.p1 TRINITY_DN49957_c0_g1~~TRINITY_DN49957_c0_g1_i1.p1  ORF type:complete len:101 (+),score=24.11 TRINITY_DN49957_c0_g1_i1:96-398(+)
MIRRPPRSTLSSSSAASDVYKRQVSTQSTGVTTPVVVFHCMFSQVRGPKAARMFLPHASPGVQKVLILRGGWVGFYMNVASQIPAAQKLCTIPPNYVPQF